MITLAADCLLFEFANGESIPYSADMISLELSGDPAPGFNAEFLEDTTQAVFHYFKHELGRQTVTLAEFAEAMERVLRAFATAALSQPEKASLPGVEETDLTRLARESQEGGELFFFRRLRDEFRQQMRQGPRVLRFHGVRGCVKHLLGTRRWTVRCSSLEDQIVLYLRGCLDASPRPEQLALVVE